jgi:HSP20 family protein
MTLVRLNPLREMERVFNDRFFSRFAEDAGRSFPSGGWSPAVDIYETADEVVYTAELPGFEKDQIDISVNDGRLTISGERKFSEEKKEIKYHRIERSYGSFSQSLRLPTSVDSEKISAKLVQGLLTLRLPKKKEAKPRQITVSVN